MISLDRDNVILFPKTIDYYQFELTRHLEQENYSEAIELLRFLTSIQADDDRVREEWLTLLNWLQNQYGSLVIEEAAEETEQDLLRKRVAAKSADDDEYIERMLQTLRDDELMEHKLLALEQLSFVQDHSHINKELVDWLTREEMHPLLQFKVLQTLRQRGYSNNITITRYDENVTIAPEEIPLSFDEYPEPMKQVIHIMREVCEVTHPALFYFAEQIWNEWLACIYGTQTYYILCENDESTSRIWASALHVTSWEMMTGEANVEEMIHQYQLESKHSFVWEQACKRLRQFLRNNPYS